MRSNFFKNGKSRPFLTNSVEFKNVRIKGTFKPSRYLAQVFFKHHRITEMILTPASDTSRN